MSVTGIPVSHLRLFDVILSKSRSEIIYAIYIPSTHDGDHPTKNPQRNRTTGTPHDLKRDPALRPRLTWAGKNVLIGQLPNSSNGMRCGAVRCGLDSGQWQPQHAKVLPDPVGKEGHGLSGFMYAVVRQDRIIEYEQCEIPSLEEILSGAEYFYRC